MGSLKGVVHSWPGVRPHRGVFHAQPADVDFRGSSVDDARLPQVPKGMASLKVGSLTVFLQA